MESHETSDESETGVDMVIVSCKHQSPTRKPTRSQNITIGIRTLIVNYNSVDWTKIWRSKATRLVQTQAYHIGKKNVYGNVKLMQC